MDVNLQLEHIEELELPTPSSPALPTSEPRPSPKASATGVASSSAQKVTTTPPNSGRSARRNLTRSFEEASLNTPSSKGATGEKGRGERERETEGERDRRGERKTQEEREGGEGERESSYHYTFMYSVLLICRFKQRPVYSSPSSNN